MGWFWADNTSLARSNATSALPPPHPPLPRGAGEPPVSRIHAISIALDTDDSLASMSNAQTLHHLPQPHKRPRTLRPLLRRLSMPLQSTLHRNTLFNPLVHLQAQPPKLHAVLHLQHPRLNPPIRHPPPLPRTLHHPPRRRLRQLGIPLPTTNVQRHATERLHRHTSRTRRIHGRGP